MRMAELLWAVATLAGVAGCSTSYQNIGFSGGVVAQQITATTFRIVARGNGYTSATAIQDYTVLKAAETAKQAGCSHFAMISSTDASSAGHIVTPGSANTTFGRNTVHTTYSPAEVQSFVRPGQDTYIRVLNIKPGEPTPPGSISADEVIQFVGPRVKRN